MDYKTFFTELPKAKSANDFCPAAIVQSSKPFQADLDLDFTSVGDTPMSEEELEGDPTESEDDEYLSAEDDNEETMETD